MSDVRIRAAMPGDIAAIARIYADAVKHGLPITFARPITGLLRIRSISVRNSKDRE